MSEKVTTRVVRSVSEVEEIRSVWTAWQQHPNSDIDLYLNTIHSRPEFLRPHVILVHRGGCPEGMLVGRLERTVIDLRLGYMSFWKIPVLSLTFVHGGFLGTCSLETAKLLVESVRRSLSGNEADTAFFNNIPCNSPLLESSIKLPGFFCRDHFPVVSMHRSLVLPSSTEELYSRLPKKGRHALRRRSKKFLEAFPKSLDVRCFHDPGEIGRMCEDEEQIARKTYQRSLGVGFIDNYETRQRLHLRASSGQLRGFVLYVDGKPCAFWNGTLRGHVFYTDIGMGYDPDFAQYSPGMYLMMRVVEAFCEGDLYGRVREIDFGLGDAEYKDFLANREWKEAAVRLFAPRFKGVLINVASLPIGVANHLLRETAFGTSLSFRVKRLWRARLSGRAQSNAGRSSQAMTRTGD
jgi:hypothetical protein